MTVRASAIPDFPHDVDARFFHCAHPNLMRGQPLHGDEIRKLFGLAPRPQALLVCQLPEIRIHADLGTRAGINRIFQPQHQ